MSGAVENGSIVRLERVEARVEPYEWAYARENAAAIASHWATLSAGKPAMFNGRVMLQHRAAIHDGVFEAGYFETDYAAFLAWRDAGYPGPVIRNGFAMAALRASDGAFLCGKMGDHTANAGKVYFAAGTPDRDDARPDRGGGWACGAVSSPLAVGLPLTLALSPAERGDVVAPATILRSLTLAPPRRFAPGCATLSPRGRGATVRLKRWEQPELQPGFSFQRGRGRGGRSVRARCRRCIRGGTRRDPGGSG